MKKFLILFVFIVFYFLSVSVKKFCSYKNEALTGINLAQNLLNERDDIIEKELQRIFANSFGYTFIGEKAVSIEYICASDFSSHPEHKKFFFETLKRLFDKSDRFLLKIFHFTDFYSEIVLIDLKSVISLLEKDRYLFDFIKKEYGSYKKFYVSLIDPNIHIFDCLKRDNIAIGIVLGYGEENSRYYQRYLDVGFYLQKYPLVCVLPFHPYPTPEVVTEKSTYGHLVDVSLSKLLVPAACTKEFLSLEDEWNWMRQVRNKDYKETQIPYLFQLPFFISKRGENTDKIHQQYCRARVKLAQLFYGKKFRQVLFEELYKKS